MLGERTPLRSLIGGRWAVSWQGYLLAWPWAVLFIFSSSPTVWASGTFAERVTRGLIVGTITYLPVGIIAWLASISVLRHRLTTPAPILLVAVVGGVAWTTRSLAMLGYLHVSGLPSDASPTLRVVAGFLQGALAFVLTAWLLAKLTSFKDQRRRLLDELVTEELANEDLQERVTALKARLMGQVHRRVTRNVPISSRTVGERTPDTQDVDALAQATQRISRQLAKELWTDAAKSARVSPLTVIRSTAANRPFTYWALLPGALLGLIVLPIYWSVPDTVIVVTVLTTFALLVSLMTNNLCHQLRPTGRLALYSTSILLLLASALLMLGLINVLDLTPTGGAGVLWAVAVNFGIFYPLIGIGAHIGRAQQEGLARLRRSINQAEIAHHALRREESRLRQDLALALHGGLQADLTARTMRAQQSLEQGDPATARQQLDEAWDLIQRDWDLPERDTADLRSTAESVIECWEGFASITLDLRVSHAPTPQSTALIKEVLLEGIGNAVRHGRATNIAIVIENHAGALRITITDDGTGVTSSRVGLGTAMLDDMAPNAWSLSPAAAGGSMLTVALSTASRP